MGPRDIEFVSDGAPTAMPPPPRPKLWRVLLVAALLAGGVAWAVTRHSGGRPVAAPTPTPTPTPTFSITDDTPQVSFTCPKVSSGCPISRVDLAVIEAAFTQYLPTARLSSVNTTLHADHGTAIGLAERVLDAHIDSVDVLLRIRPYLHPEPAPTAGITPTPPGLGSAFFRFTTAAFVVDVQWTGTDATPPPVDKLQALADDPRLESLG